MPRHDDDDFDDRPASRRRRYEDDEEDDGRRRRRFDDDEDEYDRPRPSLPHSGLGIASCIAAGMSLLLGIVAMGIVTAAGLEDTIDTAVEAGDPQALLAAFLILGSGFLCLVGAILAAAGLAQQRQKVFAIIGLCLNGFLLLCGLGLMLLGMFVS